MAAATADRDTKFYGQPLEDTYTITTAAQLYIGCLVNTVSSTGRVTNATAALSRRFAGIVMGFPDGSGLGNTAGTTRARVAFGYVVLLSIFTAARTFTNLGKNVFIADNQSCTDTTAAGTALLRIKVGTLIKFEASDKSTGWVWIRQLSESDAV